MPFRKSKAGKRRRTCSRRRAFRFARQYGERLEPRLLLATDWQSPYTNRDMNLDGIVTPIDALIGINEINEPTIIGAEGQLPPRSQHPDAPYYDTNGDGFLVPGDILPIINALNEDITAPVVTLSLAHDSAPKGASDRDGISFQSTITGTALDALTGVQQIVYSINGGPVQVMVPALNGSFSFAANVPEGENTVMVRARDGLGNLSESSEFHFTFDSTPPEINLTAAGSFVTSGVLDLAGQLTDTHAGVESLLAQIDLADVVEVPLDADGFFNFTASLPTDTSADGDHIVRLRATDRAGNLSTLTSVDWVVDTQPLIIATNLDAVERTAISVIELTFNEPPDNAGFDVSNFTLTRTTGPNAPLRIAISSLERADDQTVRLILE